MSKKKLKESVFQDWALAQTFQVQTLLATGFRGPDGIEKHNAAKDVLRYYRGATAKPAATWDRANDSFMRGDWGNLPTVIDAFWADHDKYPHHFIMHLVHCAQVLGYKHSSAGQRYIWKRFYLQACESFHMRPETESAMDKRLNDFGEGIHNNKKL